MACSRAVLMVVLGGVLAACGTASAPSLFAPGTDAPNVATKAATVSPAAIPLNPSPSATLHPTPKPTQEPVPPKPAGVKWDELVRVSDDESVAEITQKVTWRAPRSEGVEIRVYGVTECVAEPDDPRPDTHGPCLVEHTPLQASIRTQLATAPASDGVVSWTWTEDTGCDVGLHFDPDGPRYYAVVLAAYSASGHSIFTIAEPGGWWQPGVGDLVC